MTLLKIYNANCRFFFLLASKPSKLVHNPENLSVIDKLGMNFEIALTNFFTDLGTLFARYPLPVIVLSVGFAVGLSTGIKWLDVTTDPIGKKNFPFWILPHLCLHGDSWGILLWGSWKWKKSLDPYDYLQRIYWFLLRPFDKWSHQILVIFSMFWVNF